MFTQQRVPFSRSAALAAMLAAMVFFAWTSRLSAGPVFGTNILEFTGDVQTVNPPSLSGLSITTPPSTSNTLHGFSITALDYTIANKGTSSMSVEVTWIFARDYQTTGPLSVIDSIGGSLSITTSGGSVTGSLAISAALYPGPFLTTYNLKNEPTPFSNSAISTTVTSLSGTSSWSKANFPPSMAFLPATGSDSSDFAQLVTDLNVSIPAGASIRVDPHYDFTAFAAPEPSALVLFAIPSTMLLAGLARRRRLSRRRCGSVHFAATSRGG